MPVISGANRSLGQAGAGLTMPVTENDDRNEMKVDIQSFTEFSCKFKPTPNSTDHQFPFSQMAFGLTGGRKGEAGFPRGVVVANSATRPCEPWYVLFQNLHRTSSFPT